MYCGGSAPECDAASQRRLIGECQRRPEKLHSPPGAEAVERGLVWRPVAHDLGKLGEKCESVERWSDQDVVARPLIGNVDEPMLGAAGNADDVARLRIEATTVHLVEIPPLEDPKDLRLGMLVPRRRSFRAH
jgi:hypothetical protein